MIDELKAIEESYSNRINEFKVESYDLEEEKRLLNETFRDVNLFISTLNQQQAKNDEACSMVKSSLSEISQMKTFMTESNDFEPNLPFNRDWFGLLSTKSSSTFKFDKNQNTFVLPLNFGTKIATTEHKQLNRPNSGKTLSFSKFERP